MRATSAGNVRKGPRVLEGWADAAEQRRAHDEYVLLGKMQEEPVREAIKAWTAEQGYGWPMAKEELAATTLRLNEIAAEIGAAAEPM